MSSNNNDYNIIDISKSKRSGGSKKYFCNNCNRSLFLNDKDTQEYICSNCNITYHPNNQLVKKANRIETPGPDTDEHGNITGNNIPPIAMLDEPNKELSSTLYKQQKLAAAYQALEKQGYKFTSYEER